MNYNLIRYTNVWETHTDNKTIILYDSSVIGEYNLEIPNKRPNDGVLVGLHIQPEFRNKGFGKILIKDLIEKSKNLQLNKLWLKVDKINSNAIHLYESNGFTFHSIDTKSGIYNWMLLEIK